MAVQNCENQSDCSNVVESKSLSFNHFNDCLELTRKRRRAFILFYLSWMSRMKRDNGANLSWELTMKINELTVQRIIKDVKLNNNGLTQFCQKRYSRPHIPIFNVFLFIKWATFGLFFFIFFFSIQLTGNKCSI